MKIKFMLSFQFFSFVFIFFVLNYHIKFQECNAIEKNTNISVVIKLKDENPYILEKLSNDLKENSIKIDKLREKNKDYYSKHNNKFIYKVLKVNGTISKSEFSPFVFIEYENYQSYIKDYKIYKKISHSNNVEKVYVENKPIIKPASSRTDIVQNISASTDLLDFQDAKEMIGVNDSNYTGEGIKVGIFDVGYPDNTRNFTHGEIKAYKTNTTSYHTNKIASIIGGTYGIAPDVDLYIHSFSLYDGDYQLDDGIEWMINNGVNVINFSQYTDDLFENFGKYDGHSAYIDNIIWRNNITFVKSAGNTNSNNLIPIEYITNPGLGTNVITVGNIDKYQRLAYNSLYEVDSSISDKVMKPNVVAFGENLIIPNTSNSHFNSDNALISYSGTSYSAPMVTGMIALLMEEFPLLMNRADLVASLIMSSANPLTYQPNVWNDYAGAGLINYQNARQIMLYNNYKTSTATTDPTLPTYLIEKEINLLSGEIMDFCLFNKCNSEITSPSNNIYSPRYSKFNVGIYDGNTLVSSLQYGTNTNSIIGTFKNTSSTSKTYNVKVSLSNGKVGGYPEYIALTLSKHTHIYNHDYMSTSNSQHNSYCYCGNYISENHTSVSNCPYCGPTHGHAYTYRTYNNYYHRTTCYCGYSGLQGHILRDDLITCILCGAFISSGGIISPFNLINKQYITENGTYVLSNGLIIISDYDYNLYLRGELDINTLYVF